MRGAVVPVRACTANSDSGKERVDDIVLCGKCLSCDLNIGGGEMGSRFGVTIHLWAHVEVVQEGCDAHGSEAWSDLGAGGEGLECQGNSNNQKQRGCLGRQCPCEKRDK